MIKVIVYGSTPSIEGEITGVFSSDFETEDEAREAMNLLLDKLQNETDLVPVRIIFGKKTIVPVVTN